MPTLYATVAVYNDIDSAERDWAALDEAGARSQVEIADAAFLGSRDGETQILQRWSHHGWGKGAVIGAVVGVLFPPTLLGAMAVGAGGGALVSRMTRALGRSKVKELGEALDSGSWAIVVVATAASSEVVDSVLESATTIKTAPSSSTEEIQEVLAAS